MFPMRLPMPRDPEWSVSQTRPSSSVASSMKMVPAAERPERQPPRRIDRRVVVCGARFELAHASRRRFGERLVDPARAHRDGALDAGADARRIGDTLPAKGRPDRDHPAADVHADRRRNDGPFRGDHGPDRGALAVVAVGHHGHVLVDERHRGRVLDLAPCARFHRLGRQEQHRPIVQPEHAKVRPVTTSL